MEMNEINYRQLIKGAAFMSYFSVGRLKVGQQVSMEIFKLTAIKLHLK